MYPSFTIIFFVLCRPPNPHYLHSFPTRRSSDLVLRPSCNAHDYQHSNEYACTEITLPRFRFRFIRSEEHTSELQSPMYLVCRLLLEKKKTTKIKSITNVFERLSRATRACRTLM